MPEGEVFRRLLQATVGDNTANVDKLIRAARVLHPDVYTHRVLADAFKMSHSNVSYVINQKGKQDELGAAGSGSVAPSADGARAEVEL